MIVLLKRNNYSVGVQYQFCVHALGESLHHIKPLRAIVKQALF